MMHATKAGLMLTTTRPVRSIVSAVLVVAAFAAGCASDGSDSGNSDDAAAASTDDTAASEEGDTATTTATDDAGPEPECAYTGTDPNFGDMQVELTFNNPLGEVDWFEVTYALLDGEGGTRFFTGDTAGIDLQFPSTNEAFRVAVDAREELPPGIDEATIDCTVLGIEERGDIGGFERPGDDDTCTVLGTDSDGDIQVEVSATSPYDQTTEIQTWWALQAQGQVRFDTETEVIDLVGAGETFLIAPDRGTPAPEWVGDGEVTCFVAGYWDHGR